LLARKIPHRLHNMAHHFVAGQFLAIIGILYALVLGLTVVDVQTKFDRARTDAATEANSCSDLWNLSRTFPPEFRHEFRAPIKDYYTIVQKENWERIEFGERSDGSKAAFQRIWKTLLSFQPESNKQVASYDACLTTLKEMSDARAFRIGLHTRGVPLILWVVLIAGAVLTTLFILLFWLENPRTQAVLTVLVETFIVFNLLLIYIFNTPFRPELGIKKSTFSFNPRVLNDSSVPLPNQDGNSKSNLQDPVMR
jgi:Protein of unknown function (DUF4239)